MTDLRFPLYRALANRKSFYCISAPDEMTEYQQIGSKYVVHSLKARILPEHNLLRDLISNDNGHWHEVTAEEFDAFVTECERDRERLH